MRANQMSKLSTILFTLILACAASGFSTQGTAPIASGSRLTIKESLIPVFASGFLTPGYHTDHFPFDRLNPGIREYLLFYLREDDAVPPFARGALFLLGFVGEADDLAFVEEYISGKLNAYRKSPPNLPDFGGLANCAGCFGGMMASRQVAGSAAFIQKYASISAWRFSDTNLDPEGSSENFAREAYSNFIVGAFNWSHAEYLRPLLEERAVGHKRFYHESIPDVTKREVSKYERLFTPSIPEEKIQHNIDKCMEAVGTWIDMLVRKETLAERSRAEAERAAERAKATRPKPQRRIPWGFVESAALAGIIPARCAEASSEAVEAFEQAAEKLFAENAGTLPVKREMLQEVRAGGPRRYDNFHFNIHVVAQAGNILVDKEKIIVSEPVITRAKESCAVMFEIGQTADIARKHAATAVSARTGDMMVHMKMVDRAWYWDPDPDTEPLVPVEIVGNKPRLRADLKANASSIAAKAIVDDELLVAAVGEAIAAYTAIAESIIRGDYDVMTLPLVTNAGFTPSEARRGHESRMRAFFETRKKMLVDLKKSRSNQFAECRIEIYLDGTETPTSAGPLIGREIIQVIFRAPHAAGIYKKHAGEFASDMPIDKEGNLYNFMQRINGKWYWSAFLPGPSSTSPGK